MLDQYPYITPRDKNSFAHFTLKTRLPKIIDDIIEDGPHYDESTNQALLQLKNACPEVSIRELSHTPEERSYWDEFYDRYLGSNLDKVPFFYGEIYFYALIREIMGYEQPDQDPFLPQKRKELETNLDFFQKVIANWQGDQLGLADCIDLSLNGNKADLSQLDGPSKEELTILIDNKDLLVKQLQTAKIVHILLDNAGVELFTDLLLALQILKTGANKVVLHAKPSPVFVSDTILADIKILLSHLETIGKVEFTEEVRKMILSGRLEASDHIFWNTPNHFTQLPESMIGLHNASDVLISKGDANYRRFFEDRVIPATEDALKLCDYLSVPTYALRTLKSEIQVGLNPAEVKQLNQSDSTWMTAGRCAVIQKLH